MKKFNEDYWLFFAPTAHRGLHHGKDIPENSLTAFYLAIKNNYPIELDVHLTKDKKLVVFHDDNLFRVTGKNADIRDSMYDDIKDLKLYDSDETIPLFSEVLKLVDGKVPLLIEIKQQKQKGIEKAVLDELKNYSGEFAIQSFDPFVLFKIKKLDKNIVYAIFFGFCFVVVVTDSPA